MRKALIAGLIALGLVLIGLAVAPAKIDPQPWQPAPIPEETGAYAPNDRLKGAERLAVDLPQPEAIVFDSQGRLLTGLADGRIVRMTDDGKDVTTFATVGRPYG
jgi:hypothetical protein